MLLERQLQHHDLAQPLGVRLERLGDALDQLHSILSQLGDPCLKLRARGHRWRLLLHHGKRPECHVDRLLSKFGACALTRVLLVEVIKLLLALLHLLGQAVLLRADARQLTIQLVDLLQSAIDTKPPRCNLQVSFQPHTPRCIRPADSGVEHAPPQQRPCPPAETCWRAAVDVPCRWSPFPFHALWRLSQSLALHAGRVVVVGRPDRVTLRGCEDRANGICP